MKDYSNKVNPQKHKSCVHYRIMVLCINYINLTCNRLYQIVRHDELKFSYKYLDMSTLLWKVN